VGRIRAVTHNELINSPYSPFSTGIATEPPAESTVLVGGPQVGVERKLEAPQRGQVGNDAALGEPSDRGVRQPGKNGDLPVGAFPDGFFQPTGERFDEGRYGRIVLASGHDVSSVVEHKSSSWVDGLPTDTSVPEDEQRITVSGPLGRGRKYSDERARIDDLLANYSPRVMSEVEWLVIRAFVIEHAERLFRDFNRYHHATQFMLVLVRLTAFAHFECGAALKANEIFEPQMAERFIASVSGPDRTRATWRSRLRYVGPILAPKAGWERPPTQLSRSQVQPPYSATELDHLQTLVSRMSGSRRQLGRVVLAFGLGVGADGRNIPRLYGRDVMTNGTDVYVRLDAGGTFERIVPVLPAYRDEVLALAKEVAPDELIIRHPNRVNSELGKISSPDPAVAPGRIRLAQLRTTYIVGLIDQNVPVRVILYVSGLGFSTRLASYAAFASEYGFDAIDNAIRAVK